MSTVLYVLIAILMLGILIFLHELGHYLVGRTMNIGINEFAVGMGPKLFSWKGTHKIKLNGQISTETTAYSLRILPLGGFCAFVGEDDESDDPRAMNKAPAWKRFLTVFAGPLMNVLIAFLIGVVLISAGLIRNLFVFETEYQVITKVEENMPAEDAGFQPNDIILSINGIDMLQKSFDVFQTEVAKGGELQIAVKRGEETISLSVTPAPNEEGRLMIGVEVYSHGSYADYHCNIFESFVESFKLMKNITVETYRSLPGAIRSLFTDDEKEVKGVVGLVQNVSVSLDEGFSSAFSDGVVMILLYLMVISISLGIMNLLPIPALDGGRLLFLFFEMITGKHLNRKLEGYINFVFLVLLILFMLYIMFFDVKALFR